MKKIQSFLLLLLFPVCAFFTACNGQDGYTLKGTLNGAANLQIVLDQAHFDRSNVAVGRATCDAKGMFTLNQKEPFAEGLYRLTIGAKRLYFMLSSKDQTIEITGDLNTIDRMEVEVKGSETFTCYKDIISGIIKTPLKTPDEAKSTVNRGCTPLMQAFLATQLLGQNAGSFLEDFKAYDKALAAAMPGSKYSTDFTNMITQITTQMATQQAAETIKVGMDAPDISLPGPDGKVHSLAALKGKIVLLDFWASWCGPCRRENPHVVENYKKYNAKGFEVFSVSLDKTEGKQAWIDAIAKDGLLWPNHVSDLKFWDSAPAAVYGVRSIPKTFLIGRDGKIVAINPRENLEAELMKVL